MKKLIYLIIAVTLFSCSDEDNSLQSIEIDRDQITMHYDEDEQLGIVYNPLDADETPPVTWFSEDNNVAEISSGGIVEGVHVGETRIMAQTEGGKFQDYSEIIIEPYSSLYATPCIDLGCAKSDVKNFEDREILLEEDESIIYNGENTDVFAVMYLFEDGFLNGVSVLLEEKESVAEEVALYLMERYVFEGNADNLFVFTVNQDVVAVLSVTYDLGLAVVYMENVLDKSAVIREGVLTANQERIANKLQEYFN